MPMKYLVSIIVLILIALAIIFGIRGFGGKSKNASQNENASATVTARAPDGTEIVATVEEPKVPLAIAGNTTEETGEAVEVTKITGETYAINNNESSANWSGTKIGTNHTGGIGIGGGTFSLDREAKIISGSITFDTTKITVTDIEGEAATSLREHLEGEDFFDIVNHPTAQFTVTNHDVAEGLITGDLTIRDTTESIDVPVTIVSEGDTVKISGEASVDRTVYGMKFGSIKFFPDIADAAVSDTFTLSFDIEAVK